MGDETATSMLKRQAAEHAVAFVQSGMTVGLGTGSTAIFATRHIAALLQEGALREVVAFATSVAVRREAESLGIPLLADDMPRAIDLTIDGADEIDPRLDLIKGGGGALLREKIVAEASRRVIIVADDGKLSPCLGTRWPVPVEVLPYGWQSQARYLATLGAEVALRRDAAGAELRTDQGNLILDCRFGPIADAADLARSLAARAGIMEHGLFLGIAHDVVIAGCDGIRHLRRGGGGAAGLEGRP
ncbi:Ribose-5-phosphate isomerase A [Rhodovastum atsumiense]|uniref:Ribose-5-phosphate isomerase A n=1 Tax=Rhodovastum atsumiense TaxID=504468 RepID=A0A5M6IKN7_9PROT|nr:ribose-5-phosphate isomerase RpiA [Rhodovastum atsumiense]KAA5608118.1 ribose-5-phosphate isomerase RpiA [Rhodovastum atsumiense]CAH2600770.1 Ribose-5-phosphate isomerase A [Rhodovastum atsumiense]